MLLSYTRRFTARTYLSLLVERPDTVVDLDCRSEINKKAVLSQR